MEVNGWAFYSSPVGLLKVEESCGKIVSCHRVRKKGRSRLTPLVESAVKQLDEYFLGTRKTFRLPLSSIGTPFQKKVWQFLRNIPYGETRTYGGAALIIGHPRASRAVGGACGKNPHSIIVPCHRVTAATAGGGGFGMGLPAKRYLLELERSKFSLENQGPL